MVSSGPGRGSSRKKRVALLGFYHESNTFVREPTTMAEFRAGSFLVGDEIRQIEGEAHSSLAGFLSLGETGGVEVVPLISARATPSGAIMGETFEEIASLMLGRLEAEGPWDAVFLALHGAAVVDTYPDADGELIARVQRLIGERIPIGVALDMHANVSSKMVRHSTVVTLYQTNPHVDAFERAAECGDIVLRAARGEVSPVQALVRVPAVVNILAQGTYEEPMRGIVERARQVLGRPGMLAASVAEGYPYADVAEMGMAVVVVHDGSAKASKVAASEVAREVWRRRHEFTHSVPSAEEAVAAIGRGERGPVVMMDVGDNIGGGAPGDSVVLLEAALLHGVHPVLAIVVDPRAVATCRAVAAGTETTLTIGNRRPEEPGKHGLPLTVTVSGTYDGRFEEPAPTHGGFRHFDAGDTAVVATAHGDCIILISKRLMPASIRQVTGLGIEPRDFRLIVAKGVHSPRPAYEPIASRVVMVDTPGVTSADLRRFDYSARPRPLFPFEQAEGFGPYADL